MGRWFSVVHADGYTETITCGDAQALPDGDWEGCTLTELEREPGEYDVVGEDGSVFPDLPKIEAMLLARIDAEAGAVRLRFITDTPGQALTYRKKEDEARDHQAGGAGPWPMLEAEAAATEQSVAALAAEVFAAANLWVALGAAIEGARMGAKKSVREAESGQAKRDAAVIDWEALIGT